MTAKYTAQQHRYTDVCMGWGTKWEPLDPPQLWDTLSDVLDWMKENAESSFISNGNYKIFKRTIDEETFFVGEILVGVYIADEQKLITEDLWKYR